MVLMLMLLFYDAVYPAVHCIAVGSGMSLFSLYCLHLGIVVPMLLVMTMRPAAHSTVHSLMLHNAW